MMRFCGACGAELDPLTSGEPAPGHVWGRTPFGYRLLGCPEWFGPGLPLGDMGKLPGGAWPVAFIVSVYAASERNRPRWGAW